MPRGIKTSILFTETHIHLSKFLSTTFLYIPDFWFLPLTSEPSLRIYINKPQRIIVFLIIWMPRPLTKLNDLFTCQWFRIDLDSLERAVCRWCLLGFSFLQERENQSEQLPSTWMLKCQWKVENNRNKAENNFVPMGLNMAQHSPF